MTLKLIHPTDLCHRISTELIQMLCRWKVAEISRTRGLTHIRRLLYIVRDFNVSKNIFVQMLLLSLNNALQDTATHCKTLQHTAAHYNSLQHAGKSVHVQWKSVCGR